MGETQKKQRWLETLDTLAEESENSAIPFHDKARLDITRKFLKCYFWLIVLILIGSFAYNGLVSWGILTKLDLVSIGNVIALIVGNLGTALGLIIGFYFKDK
jgi:hypothetical protein